MKPTHRDPRPGRPSAEERKKTTQHVSKKLATSSTERETLKRAVEDLDAAGPQGPKDMG